MREPPYTQPYGIEPKEVRPLATTKGLKYLTWGILCLLIAMILVLPLSFVAMGVVIPSDQTQNVDMGLLAGLCGLVCGEVILIIIIFVLFLLGLIQMYKGKEEFGPKHSRKVVSAIVFIVLFIVLFVVGAIVEAAMISPYLKLTDTIEVSALRSQMIVGGIFAAVQSFFFFLGAIFLIYELTSENHKNLLWMALVVGLVVSSIGTLIAYSALPDQATITPQEYTAMPSYSYLSTSLSFIPWAIFLALYWKAYQRVRTGEALPYEEQMRYWYKSGRPPQWGGKNVPPYR